LDRFDLVVEVPALDLACAGQGQAGEGSREVRTRVERARSIQRRRFPGSKGKGTNADMAASDLELLAPLGKGAIDLLRQAGSGGRLSARGFCRVLRVARTLADLAATEEVGRSDLMEALMFRLGDGP
jgi:magnesium chelatase family protein